MKENKTNTVYDFKILVERKETLHTEAKHTKYI
jgi:hypothetical protein